VGDAARCGPAARGVPFGSWGDHNRGRCCAESLKMIDHTANTLRARIERYQILCSFSFFRFPIFKSVLENDFKIRSLYDS